MNLVIAILFSLVILLLCVAGMSVGLFFNRKPIKHCGGAAFEHKGTKIECGACANRGTCKNKKNKPQEA
jgi:hypothetical protein